MNTKNLVVNDGCEGKIGEYFYDLFPRPVVSILFGDLVIEPIDSGERTGLMVASEHNYLMRVEAFEAEQIANGFDGVIPSVYIVS